MNKNTKQRSVSVELLVDNSKATKLQGDLNRKVGDVAYYKWRINIPPDFISELDWKKSENLTITMKGNKLIIEKS